MLRTTAVAEAGWYNLHKVVLSGGIQPRPSPPPPPPRCLAFPQRLPPETSFSGRLWFLFVLFCGFLVFGFFLPCKIRSRKGLRNKTTFFFHDRSCADGLSKEPHPGTSPYLVLRGAARDRQACGLSRVPGKNQPPCLLSPPPRPPLLHLQA